MRAVALIVLSLAVGLTFPSAAVAAGGRAAAAAKKKAAAAAAATAPEKAADKAPEKAATGGGAPAGAPTGDVAVGPRGPTRIDFDDRLIQGQTNKSGAVYLFDRKELSVRSMVRQRTSFRDQIVRDILTE